MMEIRETGAETAGAVAGAAAGVLDVFRYAVAEKTGLYRAILGVFFLARDHYQIQLRATEVREELDPAPPEEEVSAALEQLAVWGNLDRSQDTRDVTSLAEFYRRRYLYQLTPAGEEAEKGLRAVERVFRASAGRLSSVMLPAIRDRLAALLAEWRGGRDAEKLYTLLAELHVYSSELAENARRFMRDLAVSLENLVDSEESYLAYKKAVLAYLDDFVGKLGRLGPEIAAHAAELDDLDPAEWIGRAAEADRAPRPDGTDEGPVVELVERWQGLVRWFVGDRDRRAEADRLREAAVGAIHRILVVVTRLNDQRYRRVDRAADFLRLASWFASAPSDREAHELFDRAFGLFSARHFTAGTEDEEAARGRSWRDAEPVRVAPRLRTAGRREAPGRNGRIPDWSRGKQAVVDAIRRRNRASRRAAAAFLDRELRISDLDRVGREEFDFLLGLLDAALRRRTDRDGVRRAVTPDGRYRVELVRDGPAETRLETEDGVLRLPDFRLRLVAAGGDR